MAGRWRTKSVEQSIADTDEPGTQLRKDLSWWHLAVFGVSVVIGAGIFTVTASTAGDITGPAIWISFLIAATTCGLAALCYAEFASMLPVAGSAYTFSYATFGEFLAWTIGWNLVLELAIGGAVVAKGWSSYLDTVFGLTSATIDLGSFKLDWGSLLIVALVATLLALGTKLSSHFSIVVTTIKVSVVVLVIVVGAFYIKTANYSPFIPPPENDHAGTGVDQSLLSLFTGTGCSRERRSCSSRSSGSTSWPPWPRRPSTRNATSPGASSSRWASSPSSTWRCRSCCPGWFPTPR